MDRHCSRCGHNMTDNKETYIGVSFSIKGLDIQEHSEITRLRETYGVTMFELCWCCTFELAGVPKIKGV